MNKKLNVWWSNLAENQKHDFIAKVQDRKAVALSELELNWDKAKIFKIKKTKMLIPYSEKLKDYYFFNKKDKEKYDMMIQ